MFFKPLWAAENRRIHALDPQPGSTQQLYALLKETLIDLTASPSSGPRSVTVR